MARRLAKILLGATAAVNLLSSAAARADTIVGDRLFPATLSIDDPGVNDEFTAPIFSYLTSASSDGAPASQNYALGWGYAKTITDTLGISVGSAGYQWQRRPNAGGWGQISTQLKQQLWQDDPSEAIMSAAVAVNWGKSAAPGVDETTVVSEKIFAGKGFGQLSAVWAKPLALTGEVDYVIPATSLNARGGQYPTLLNYGATLQYSLRYLSAHGQPLPAFWRDLVPCFEAEFSTPVAHVDPTPPGAFNNNATTGVVGPSVYWIGQGFQIGLMAQIPINAASGQHLGVMAALDFYLEDIFPHSLGRALFSAPTLAAGD